MRVIPAGPSRTGSAAARARRPFESSAATNAEIVCVPDPARASTAFAAAQASGKDRAARGARPCPRVGAWLARRARWSHESHRSWRLPRARSIDAVAHRSRSARRPAPSRPAPPPRPRGLPKARPSGADPKRRVRGNFSSWTPRSYRLASALCCPEHDGLRSELSDPLQQRETVFTEPLTFFRPIRNDKDCRAGRQRQRRRSGDDGREWMDGRRLHDVEGLAFSDPAALVDQPNHASNIALSEHVRNGAAELSCADDADLNHGQVIIVELVNWRVGEFRTCQLTNSPTHQLPIGP